MEKKDDFLVKKIIGVSLFLTVLLAGLYFYFFRTDIRVFSDRLEYWRYEFVPIYVQVKNLVLRSRLKNRKLTATVRSDKDNKIVTTIGGRNEIRLKFNPQKGYWEGFWPAPWNSAGKYSWELKISPPLEPLDPLGKNYKIRKTGFALVARTGKNHAFGLRVLTLESNTHWATMQLRSPDGEMKDWKAMLDWVKFAQANTFWCLLGQTAAFYGKLDPKFPWIKHNLKMIPQMARECHKRGLKFGGWVMAYLTFGQQSLLPDKYQYAWDYDNKTGQLYPTRSISLNDPERVKDLIIFFKKLNNIPELDYIGIDYIRNALGGYELVDDFVREMDVAVPTNWKKFSREERMLWLVKKKIDRQDMDFIDQWQWWRAHRAALIIKKIRDEVHFNKPFFAYTLSWEKGWQHGQDPVMFYDAGIDIDAIMLYECNRDDYEDLINQWHNYLKKGQANIIVGDVIDQPLHQFTLEPAGPEEFYYRNLKAIEKLYSDGVVTGVFLHDLGRALWGRVKPYPTKEWLFVGGAVCSQIAQICNQTPFKVEIDLPEKVNLSEEFLVKVKITKLVPETPSDVNVKLLLGSGVTSENDIRSVKLEENVTYCDFSVKINQSLPERGLRYFIGCQANGKEGSYYTFKYTNLTGQPVFQEQKEEVLEDGAVQTK